MKTDFLKQLFELLNEQYPYAVLRNHEELPEECSSRDIDILILRKDLRKIKKTLFQLAKANDCREFYHFQDHQFYSVIYFDSEMKSVQLDFQYNFAWMGLDLLDEKMVLDKRIFNGKVYHLPPEFVFLPKYLYCRILGAKYPEKYSEVRDSALKVGADEIENILKKLSFGKSLEEWDRIGKFNLRTRVFGSTMLRRPLRAISRMTGFLTCYLRDLFFLQ